MKSWSLYLTLIGALLGAAGTSRGADYTIYLDTPEQAAMAETFHFALEHNQLNQQSSWFNPDTGHSGTIMPVRSFYSTEGLSCREYFQSLQFDDTLERRLGIACRQPDGLWEVMHEQFLSDAYLEGEASLSFTLDHDPFERYYPWVYYDPFDYPYPIYFSFVFVSHRHHYQPRHFHSGHRFNTHLFRDGRHLRHREQRSDPPRIREQPSAPRFDRGTAPPRQRLESDLGREPRTPQDRGIQRDQNPPQRRPRVEVSLPPSAPGVSEHPLPSSEAPVNRERLERGERRPPPADLQRDDTRKSDQNRKQEVREEKRDRSQHQLGSERGEGEDHRGQREKERRRSERRERDDEEGREDRSGGRDRR